MTTQQPEALRLAWLLELAPEDGVEPQTTEDAAAELRRQHARIAELQARIKTMAEEHADELMVAHLDGRVRAAQPAGAQQPGDERAAFEAWIKKDGGDLSTFGSDQNIHYSNSAVNNAWAGWKARASHGQAPAQPCMAKQSPHPEYGKGFSDGWDRCEARQAAELDEVKTVCAQAYQVVGILLSEAGRFDSPEAEKILDNLGEQRLRHTDVLPWESKAAPQQEAQEPAAWMTQEGDRVVTEKTMNAARRGGGAMLTSLHSYSVALVRAAAPQPSPVAQGDAEDAARYRWLREHSLAAGQGSITVELDDRANGHFSRSIFLAELDAAIDAARSAGGQKP